MSCVHVDEAPVTLIKSDIHRLNLPIISVTVTCCRLNCYHVQPINRLIQVSDSRRRLSKTQPLRAEARRHSAFENFSLNRRLRCLDHVQRKANNHQP